MKQLVLILVLGLLTPRLHSQQFYSVVKKYYRVNPFAGKFSSFIEAVKTDPELTDLYVKEKTDSSLFVVKGKYRSFNPFSIKSSNIELLLAEKKVDWGNATADTIIYYQISGFFDSNATTMKMLKKEYSRIVKTLKKSYGLNKEMPLNKISGITDGALTSFAGIRSFISPVSVGWYSKANKQIALIMVVRMQYMGNKAVPGDKKFTQLLYLDQ